MGPLLLRLVSRYGPRILKVINKQAVNLPKIPAKQPKNVLDALIKGNPISRKHSSTLRQSAELMKKYPNLFRSIDMRLNLANASNVRKALKLYNPHKKWTRSTDKMKLSLPRKMSPLSRNKFKRITNEY